jgi:hypothetical protein
MLSLISEQVRFVKLKERLCRRRLIIKQRYEIIDKKITIAPETKKSAKFVGSERGGTKNRTSAYHSLPPKSALAPDVQNCIDHCHTLRID